MITNVGKTDRIIRTVVAAIFIYVALAPTAVLANEGLRLFVGIWGLVNLLTALTGYCPMYSLASLNTNKKQ